MYFSKCHKKILFNKKFLNSNNVKHKNLCLIKKESIKSNNKILKINSN